MKEKKAAVIGTPIKHSLSPIIHNFWLKECGIKGNYDKIEVKKEDLLEFFTKDFFSKELLGVNVTVPHKEQTFEIIKKIGKTSDLADKIAAVNTVFLRNGVLYGDNTDYYGFKTSLQEVITDFSKKKFLIIGAGGAAKAIIAGLVLQDGMKNLSIINRTEEKARNIAQNYPEKSIITGNLAKISEFINQAEIIVQTTSCGLNGEHNLEIDFSEIVKRERIFYDIVYKPLKTKFLLDAEKNGNKIITGINMLLYQAVPAFEYFFKEKLSKEKIEKLKEKGVFYTIPAL